jgi:transposase-like protein
MRYPASEKLEIIRIVEQSHLPARRTLEQLGIARRTFCRWYDRYLDGGPEALEDRPSAAGGKGGLVEELLAARGAGSPVSFTVWLMHGDGHSPST